MTIFLYILLHNILPIFLIIMIGFLIGKRFHPDTLPLTRLNFYAYVPFFIFVQVYTTDMPRDIYKVLLFAVVVMAVVTLAVNIFTRLRGYDQPLRHAFLNSIIFYNSGNIGIPLMTLVFSSAPFIVNGKTPYLSAALMTQVAVLIVQNLTTNTLGFYIAGKGKMSWRDSLRSIITMPTVYMIVLAFALKCLPFRLESLPIWPAFVYLQQGMISFALLTLGVQLSRTKFSLRSREVYLSNFIRLIGVPALACLLIRLMDIHGIPAQVLMISSALPTAVNTALIAVDRGNEADFACQAVMTATIFSSVTLVFVVYLSRILFPV